jgi:hypothetical protein
VLLMVSKVFSSSSHILDKTILRHIQNQSTCLPVETT